MASPFRDSASIRDGLIGRMMSESQQEVPEFTVAYLLLCLFHRYCARQVLFDLFREHAQRLSMQDLSILKTSIQTLTLLNDHEIERRHRS